MNRNIVFYISGHGFGHATRMCAIINALYGNYPDINIFIRSNAPEWIFRDTLERNFHYQYLLTDTGTHQIDFIHLDKKESFLRYDSLIKQRTAYMKDEISFIRTNNIDIIVGDIPPSAFYIAHSCGIKSIAISNFSWDWIFTPYLHEYPEFEYIIEDMITGYSYADILLKLPFSGDFSAFKKTIDIPLVVRTPKMEPDELKYKLGLQNESRPVLLCSFGGFNINNFDFAAMAKKNPNYFFISFGSSLRRESNFLILPFRSEFDHPSLVLMSDITVSKLGYGTVAECVAASTPIIYISRGDFKEYPVLEEGVKNNIPSYLMPDEDFFNGRWNRHIIKLLDKISDKRLFAPMDTSGSIKSAEIIYHFGNNNLDFILK